MHADTPSEFHDITKNEDILFGCFVHRTVVPALKMSLELLKTIPQPASNAHRIFKTKQVLRDDQVYTSIALAYVEGRADAPDAESKEPEMGYVMFVPDDETQPCVVAYYGPRRDIGYGDVGNFKQITTWMDANTPFDIARALNFLHVMADEEKRLAEETATQTEEQVL